MRCLHIANFFQGSTPYNTIHFQPHVIDPCIYSAYRQSLSIVISYRGKRVKKSKKIKKIENKKMIKKMKKKKNKTKNEKMKNERVGAVLQG